MCLCRGHHHGYRRRHHRRHRHRPLCSFFAATLHPADPSAGLRRTIRPAAKRHLRFFSFFLSFFLPSFLFSSSFASLNLVLASYQRTRLVQGFIENAFRISGYTSIVLALQRTPPIEITPRIFRSFKKLSETPEGTPDLMENTAYGANGASGGRKGSARVIEDREIIVSDIRRCSPVVEIIIAEFMIL